MRPADGSGRARRVTTDGGVWRFAPRWSPDGTKLAYGDRNQRLRIVDVATGKIDRRRPRRLRATSTHYGWSPDSRWLAYERRADTRLHAILVYALAAAKSTRLGDGA